MIQPMARSDEASLDAQDSGVSACTLDRVVWGLATGRHLLGPLEQGERILVLAIDLLPPGTAEVEATITGHPILQRAIQEGRLEIRVEDAPCLARRFASLQRSGGGQPAMDVHLPALLMAPPAAQPLARLVERIHLEHRSHPRVAERMRNNLAANLESMAAAPGIDQLVLTPPHRPGFVLAAGPSARAALPYLRQVRTWGPLLVVDTALPLCQAQNIPVDLVASVDPHPKSRDHVRGGSRGTGILAFQPYCHPEVVAAFPRRVWASPCGDLLFDRVSPDLGLPQVETFNTVLLYAVQIAEKVGCDPIVMVGADLAHVGGLSHARGTASARFVPDVPLSAPNCTGQAVPTTRALQRFQADLERHIRGSAHEYWVVDGGGAAIRGAWRTGWEELLPVLSSRTAATGDPARLGCWLHLSQVPSPEEAARRLELLRQVLAEFDSRGADLQHSRS
jgi:hypothetical protein